MPKTELRSERERWRAYSLQERLAGTVDRRPVRAMAERGGGTGDAEAGARQLPATLAGVEAGQ
jgi:hypothetical protein